MERQEDPFYIGYLPKAPAPLGKWLKPRVALLLVIPLLLAVLLIRGQKAFDAAFFEFGNVRQLEGVLLSQPYPMLAVERPGLGETGSAGRSLYLLTVFGKKGAESMVDGHEGQRVRLRGSLIYRDDQTMLEVEEGSLQVLVQETPQTGKDRVLGEVSLVGEIVDSKCFWGVMNPGNLKTHKSCAVRCISGGVPPVLLVRDRDGNAIYFVLADSDGGAVNTQIPEWVAQPVRITGTLVQWEDRFVLKADPKTYSRPSEPDAGAGK